MRIAALYIRVSTDDQTEYSPDAQKRLLLDYAKKNGIVVSNKYIFVEEGLSGTKADKRPQFQQMIGLAKSKEHPFDVILVWKFSRFARNQEESIVYKSLLKRNNVDVISISEPLADGPFGSLIERIIEWMDEYYSIRLSEEVKRGMTEKALRGEYQTGAPFGYSLKDGELIVNNETAVIVERIFNMYLYEGGNFFSIAQALNNMGVKTIRGNQFENRTVKYILQNPVYKGYVRWNPNAKLDLREQKNHITDIIVKMGSHEPIIPENTWNEVNKKIMNEYRPKYRKPNNIFSHWLVGILVCSDCHSTLSTSGRLGGFQCSSYTKGKCKISHYVKYEKIEKAVINALKELLTSGKFDYEIRKVESHKNNTNIINESLNKLELKSKRIADAYMNGIDTLEEYKENKAKVAKERADLLSQLEDVKEYKRTEKTDIYMLEKLDTVYSIITSDADNISKNNAIKSIVKEIVYDKKSEHINIYLYYS